MDNVKELTLRDYIATQAMNGELSCQQGDGYWADRHLHQLAERCYVIADAMLEAREKK